MLNIALLALLTSFAHAAPGIVGSVWSGLPKILTNGKTLCSPDPKDNPEFPPLSFGQSYLKFNEGTSGWFWIEEHDQCSSWFGFQTYQLQAVGTQVLDTSGRVVGSISATKLSLTGGSSGDATIQRLTFEIAPNGSALFYAKFVNSNKPGTTFEQLGSYVPYR